MFHPFRAVLLILAGALSLPAAAQVGLTVNPQIGITTMRLNQMPRLDLDELRHDAKLGGMLGADLRIGGRFYVQPGAFFTTSRSVFGWVDSSGESLEERVGRTALLLRTHVGYKIVDADHVHLRLAAGPSYDIVLGHNDDGNFSFTETDLKSGHFSLDAGLGLDLSVISLEVGYRHGLSNVFGDGAGFDSATRYRGLYATVGFVFGITEPD
jgi:hypothetical protein